MKEREGGGRELKSGSNDVSIGFLSLSFPTRFGLDELVESGFSYQKVHVSPVPRLMNTNCEFLISKENNEKENFTRSEGSENVYHAVVLGSLFSRSLVHFVSSIRSEHSGFNKRK